MKRTIAVASATALLVVGTAFVVRAQTAEGMPPCADFTEASTGSYQPPQAAGLTTPASAGKLTWNMALAAPSCPDVQYGLTVYLSGPDGDPATTPAGTILASAMTVGDGVTQVINFQLEVNDNNDGSVCVVQTSFGAPTSSTSSKTGAAFDADGPGSRLLDRGPDLPSGGDTEGGGDIYCVPVDNENVGGRSAG